jgi:hypothetical protein
MTPAELVADLNSKGIFLVANGDKLKCKGKQSVLTPELLETLREHKADLMALLSGMCFCKPPMPRADVESNPCQRCSLAGWCTACGGCQWCAFELKWNDHLEPKYRRRN